MPIPFDGRTVTLTPELFQGHSYNSYFGLVESESRGEMRKFVVLAIPVGRGRTRMPLWDTLNYLWGRQGGRSLTDEFGAAPIQEHTATGTVPTEERLFERASRFLDIDWEDFDDAHF